MNILLLACHCRQRPFQSAWRPIHIDISGQCPSERAFATIPERSGSLKPSGSSGAERVVESVSSSATAEEATELALFLKALPLSWERIGLSLLAAYLTYEM